MKHGAKMLVCLAGGLALCAAAAARAAADAGNPYDSIVERNVFGLKPPPPPPDPEANKPPPPKIYLTGITTFGGIKRALLKAQMPVKPGEEHKPGPPKGEESFILAEGQREGDIEVLKINDTPGNEYVKVDDFGTITNLNFDDNGIKTPSGPANVPVPGGRFPETRGYTARPPGMGGFHPGSVSFPQRAMRLPGAGGSVSPQAAGGGVGLPGGTSLPGVGVGGASTGLTGTSASTASALPPVTSQNTPEETALMLEANRLVHQQAIQAGRYPPLPPNPYAAAFGQGAAAPPAPTPAPQ